MTNGRGVRLGDIAEFINGFAFKPDDWSNKGKRIIRIQNLSDSTKAFNRTTRRVADKYHVQPGDLLVSWSATLGVFVWDEPDVALVNQHIFRVLPDANRVDGGYLRHMLSDALIEMERHLHGATMKHVNRGEFLSTEIPLPPLTEQKRIAAILDAADALRAKSRGSLAQLDSLLQSTFLNVFGDPITNPMRWEIAVLGEHTTKVGSGATPRGGNDSYKKNGIALIRSLNVRDGEFRWKDLARIDDAQAKKLANVVVKAEDVLLNITGASVARVCRTPDDVLPARVNQHVCIIRTSAGVEPKFLEKLLLSQSMKRKLLGIGESGATRQAITKAQVLALEIPVPPLALQRHFGAIVESIERQKARMHVHLAELDALFASLQARAFVGDL